MSGQRRPYRRARRYERRLNVDLTAELYDALTAAADAGVTSVAEVARDAIGRGLPLVRDAQRRQRRHRSRRTERREAGS